MKKTLLLTLFLGLIQTENVYALRCHGEVVDIGDHKIEVLQKCGEPEYVDERYGAKGSRLHHPRRTLDIEEYEEVLIEEWTYNFGPRKFMRILIFENGILKKIEKLGYGY